MTAETVETVDNKGYRGGVETAFSVRKTAWGGGVVLEDSPKTAQEALKKSGLDWEVVKVPTWRPKLTGEGFKQVPDKYSIVRTSDDADLGVVGKNYEPFQNETAFEFLNNLAYNGDIFYETAGALNGGKRVWVMCRVPETITIAGGDTLQPYLGVFASHDGSSAVTATTSAVRVECSNTYNMALNQAKNKYTFRHTTAGSLKLQQARESLNLQLSWDEALRLEVNKLVATDVTDEIFSKILEANFPDMKLQTPKSIAQVIENRALSTTIQDEYRPTAWGCLNSLSEVTEHFRPYRNDEARQKAVLVGWQSTLVSNVYRDLAELAK